MKTIKSPKPNRVSGTVRRNDTPRKALLDFWEHGANGRGVFQHSPA